jgi:hypothetical protein
MRLKLECLGEDRSRYASRRLVTLIALILANQDKLEDWVGLEPTVLYSGLKVRAVRHYGNQSVFL